VDPEAIRDLFASLGPVRTRSMFGGQGVYSGERIFAIAVGGELFLKADSATVALLRAAGSRPFSYERNGKVATMSYWLLPESALDDLEEAARWARLALEAADRAAKPKTGTPRS
jgi:DNA transformation protein